MLSCRLQQQSLLRLSDCSSRLSASLARSRSAPKYSARIDRFEFLFSTPDRRCATPLQHNPPAQTVWRLLPSPLPTPVRMHPFLRPDEYGSPPFQSSGRPSPRPEPSPSSPSQLRFRD